MKNIRFIIALVSSLLDELLIVVLIIWGLPKLGIELPLPVTLLIMLLFAIFAVTTFKIGTRVLKMKPVAGFSDMTGMIGKVTRRLAPIGYVKIDNELWEARSSSGNIEIGTPIIVLSQKGLRLVVKQQPPDTEPN
jgi:membrane-bound ClpP family serine protease